MEARRQSLDRLIRFKDDPLSIASEVKGLPWDSDTELVQLHRDDLVSVLQRSLDGELGTKDLEMWADLIEGREDIGLEEPYESVLKEVIHELANPSIMPELTSARIESWIAQIGIRVNSEPFAGD